VCEWRAGLLILRGRLPSYYLKQLAQATVAGIEGVDRIANEIEIAGPGERRVRTGLSTSSPC
jgi:osmotically-inducible protein OsmY